MFSVTVEPLTRTLRVAIPEGVYDPTSEGGIHWNDDTIAVEWPKMDVPYKTSEKHEAFKT